jgi:catechol 2,3-dioxygenase-like lactoylglutathione lyase family enzyme
VIDHIGIAVADYQRSKAFYERALAPDYYGAYVLDPDGHNIEAVCHQPA